METKHRFSPFQFHHKPLIKLRPSSADLDILDLMQDYDVLPSTYIKQSFDHFEYIKKRLVLLQKAHLIGVPEGYEHPNAKYRVRPLELRPLGYQLLAEHGRERPRKKGNDHFKHRYLRSIVKFSRDRAAVEISGITIRDTEDIRRHDHTPQEIRNAPDFASIPIGKSVIQPDDFWGIKYAYPKGTTAEMIFHEEDDRGTYPARSNSEKRHKDLRDMIRGYRDYIESEGYEERYGIPQVSILIHTTSLDRLATTFDIIKDECSADTAKRFLGKALPDFLRDEPLPPATAHLITEPYYRVENGTVAPFSILDTLRATAERKLK
jgi:hypothetical protein